MGSLLFFIIFAFPIKILSSLLKNAELWVILRHTLNPSFLEVYFMATITKDTIIGDILDIAPETAPVFLSIGMHCLGCPSSRGETVEQACMVHGVDIDSLLEKVNALIPAAK